MARSHLTSCLPACPPSALAPFFPALRSDGGYTSDMEARLKELLNTAQPDAVAFGGAGISNNPARWCGTEGGDPPGWRVL
jgi:hypothetical protein